MNSLIPEYKTVSQAAEAVITEKKSEFIGTVYPCTTEDAALDFLSAIRKKYSDATHNVYAYVLNENNTQRFSDDGEPSGTAGMPVLDSLRKRGLTDTAVVVTRYFGGTLLGTGGLVHAYGKCASEAIIAAKPIIRRLCNVYSLTCDYTISGKITYLTEGGEYICEDTEYTDNVTFRICIRPGSDEKFLREISEITNGKYTPVLTNKKYIDIPIN